MRIINFRKGFACNSSSTHSILLDSKLVTDELRDFNWQAFQIRSEDMANYIMAAIVGSDSKYNRQQMAVALGMPELLDDDYEFHGNVDHQSRPVFALDPRSKEVLPEFAKDLLDWFQSKKAGVHGGNDNSEDAFPPESDFKAPYLEDRADMIGRKSRDIWTLLNENDGTRIRMTFSDNPAPAISPELVDLKITGYCTFGCKYCYQGSTKEGSHASLSAIAGILGDLAAQKVLEVAIGGGEPTQHPQFRQIVSMARSMGIVPNVTTRNLDFLREFVAGLWPEIGGVAFSIDSITGAEKICGAVLLVDSDMKGRVSAQIVDKSVHHGTTLKGMLDLLKASNVRTTWLGYKNTGFGGSYLRDKWNKPGWSFEKDVLPRDEYRYRISVDTAMLSEYSEVLKSKYSAYKLTATEEEGVTSCYIDATTMQHGISSYHTQSFKPYIHGMKLI